MRTITITLLLFISNFVSAQNEFCLTDKIWAELVRKDSTLFYKRQAEDNAIAKFTNDTLRPQPSRQLRSSFGDNPTVIPTVIYIVHDGTPASNISMQQIQSQMDQLNQDFDSLGIQFCYAKRNVNDTSYFVPQAGDSAGVFRINNALTNVDQQVQDAQLKALSTLPGQNYLRIFVVKNILPAGVLGYAYFPGSSVSLDGIVVRADVFGSRSFCPSCNLLAQYDIGATLTHEAGHYLNLYHTFQGGCITGSGPEWQTCQIYGDHVCDTPPTTGSFGCPSPAPLSCDSVPVPVLIENYMDYTHDACKNSFTAGQSGRMNHALYAYRLPLISIHNLINTGVTCADFGNQYADFYCANYNGCHNRPMTFASLGLGGFTYTWNFGDGSMATGDTVQHTYTDNGQFTVTLSAVNTSQSISATGSTPVFITDCQPINCALNKWDFQYGYLDFSSGTAVATNHISTSAFFSTPDFYGNHYRADSVGNALFHINWRSIYHLWGTEAGLLDSSFNLVDSFGTGTFYTVVPVPERVNTFCVVGRPCEDSIEGANGLCTLDYSIVEATNGNARVLPGKKLVNMPFPPNTNFLPHQEFIETGIPGCDRTKFWLIVAQKYNTQGFYVFELDSSGTVSFHQYYPTNLNGNLDRIVSSPDGRKIALFSRRNGLLLNFDKGSGNITAHDTLYSIATGWTGIGSFSPNSRFLYLTEQSSIGSNTNTLYQYDLYGPQPHATRRLVSRYSKSIALWPNNFLLGPDRKIYIGFGGMQQPNAPETYRLAVINQPDVLDNGLNAVGLNMNGPDIKPPNCPYPQVNFYGFLGFIDFTDAFGCHWKPDVPPPFNYIPQSCFTYQFHSDDCFSHSWNFGDAASGASNTSTLTNPQHTFTTAGNYLVSRTINGVTISDTIKVELPKVQIAASRLQNCPTPRGNYSIALPQPDVTYSWYITNGVPAYVASATDVDVQWNDTTGLVKVIAVNRVSGCTDSATLPFNISSCFTTGLAAESESAGISIQPNPSKENFLLSSKSEFDGTLELKVANMIGEVMETKTYHLNKEPLRILIDAKAFLAGIYLIMLKTKGGMVLRKIVKE